MEWLFLLMAGLLYAAGCWLTYSEESKKAWWYLPFGIFLGALINVIWFIAAKMHTSHHMYRFTLIWDAMLMSIYYMMPLIFFGVKMDRWTLLGLSLIVTGAVIIKVKH
jgi:uncharacterized membrane protein